jgi:hypothetical protein
MGSQHVLRCFGLVVVLPTRSWCAVNRVGRCVGFFTCPTLRAESQTICFAPDLDVGEEVYMLKLARVSCLPAILP